MKRIVFTGKGAVSGCGIGTADLWKACRDGKPGVRHFRINAIQRQQRVTTASFLPPNETGLTEANFGSCCGVVVSPAVGGASTLERNVVVFAADSTARVDSSSLPKIVINAARAWAARAIVARIHMANGRLVYAAAGLRA